MTIPLIAHPKDRVSAGHRATLIRPNHVSFALATLALYGDLLKRVLEPLVALITLYGVAASILVVMVITGRGSRYAHSTWLSTLAALLIAISLAQLFSTFSQGFIAAIMATVYVCVPLAFIFIIPRIYPHFDLRALALYATVLMIPVHLIGFIQKFFDASFFISTVYSGESGGVISRNFLVGTSYFERFPSIFSSADRYSGVAMMQIFLTSVLLVGERPLSKRTRVWVAINFILGFTSLLVAGARARIIIVIVAALAAGAVFLFVNTRRVLGRARVNTELGAILIFAFGLAVIFSVGPARKAFEEMPIVVMLEETIEHGDISSRFMDAVELSMVPDDVLLFGEGPGVLGEGRPGEFAIRAMWIESGLMWTLLTLLVHAAILVWFSRVIGHAALSGNSVLTLIAVGLGLAWLFALLAGLSSTFELSQALLLFPTMAVVSTLTLRRPRGRSRRPAVALPPTTRGR